MTEKAGKEIEIKTGHFRYNAKKWGDDNGVPVLALHGWLDNAGTFDYLAPHLPDLQIVALDFPGHGFSGHRPKGYRYHYLDYVADVIEVVDALNWKEFILMGHSLGAGIASITAGAFPERITKLVLLEGIGAMTRDPGQSCDYLAKSIKQMKILGNKMPPLYENLEQMVEARAKVGDMERSSVEALVARSSIHLEDGVTWRSDPRLRITSPVYLTDDQVLSYLKGIQSTVLLITAEDGIYKDPDYLLKRCEVVNKLTRKSFPGGHHMHLDNPEPLADAIKTFIQG
jgi:pimeloyl-ACP methyl ester carboxylesterase